MSEVNWMRWNAAPMERARRRGQRGLAHAGHVLDQQVPAGEQADDGEPHHLRLADQGAPDVFLETADGFRRVAHRIPLYRRRIFRPARGRWPGRAPSATLGGAMALDPPSTPHWPRNARAACAFTFDLDAETLWMARGVHEPVTLSQGRFGPVEALPRILALLRDARHPRLVLHPGLGGRAPPGRGARHRGRRSRDRLPRRRARARERTAARPRGGHPGPERRGARRAWAAPDRSATAPRPGSSPPPRSRCSCSTASRTPRT